MCKQCDEYFREQQKEAIKDIKIKKATKMDLKKLGLTTKQRKR